MTDTKFIDDLAHKINDAIPAGIKGIQQDMEKNTLILTDNDGEELSHLKINEKCQVELGEEELEIDVEEETVKPALDAAASGDHGWRDDVGGRSCDRRANG